MIVLCSNGLSSEKLCNLVNKEMIGCKTAALVVTADNVYKENNYHVSRCVKELESLDLTVSIVDIDKQSSDSLLDYDVVEFIGGNPYYLLHSIIKNNAVEVLKHIANKKILIGWSAAVFVFGPTLELVNCYSPEMNTVGLADISGLALTNIEVLPHYHSFLRKFEHFEEKCCRYEVEHKVDVIRIDDGEGVLINGEEVFVCRV